MRYKIIYSSNPNESVGGAEGWEIPPHPVFYDVKEDELRLVTQEDVDLMCAAVKMLGRLVTEHRLARDVHRADVERITGKATNWPD